MASADREPNRWAVLALLSVAQLMVVLDATIVTIAIPSAQNALHFSTESRQWIVTAYALAFGSLLLLGGKLGDLFGRKWTLVTGLVGFSIASATGGLAESFGVLVAARRFQGAFAALLAPSALSLLLIERRAAHPLLPLHERRQEHGAGDEGDNRGRGTPRTASRRWRTRTARATPRSSSAMPLRQPRDRRTSARTRLG